MQNTHMRTGTSKQINLPYSLLSGYSGGLQETLMLVVVGKYLTLFTGPGGTV